MSRIFSINFKQVPPEKAVVSVMDRSFLYGDSIYEVIRTYRGTHLFLLDRHFKRLQRSAEKIGLHIPFSLDELGTHISDCVKASGNPDSYVRIVVSRGSDTRFGLIPADGVLPTTVVYVDTIPEIPVSSYEGGVDAALVSVLRNHPRSVDPNTKTGNYMNNMLALMEAQKKMAVEAIMLNQQGFVTEATTSNVFMVKKNVVLTPEVQSGLLEGVSRALLKELMTREGIACNEAAITEKEFVSADEIFLTGTIKEVMPVARLNGKAVGKGGVGPVTRRLMTLWREETEKISRAS